MANILLVDDDPILLSLIEAALAKAGHTAVKATDGHSALEKVGTETFDLLITDWNMPGGISGYSLVQTLRKNDRFKDLPAMLLTGRRDKADVTRALQLGIDDYLVKPVDYDMLLSKIESLLQKKPGSHSFAETPVKVDATYTLNLQVVGLSESGIAVACPTPLPVNSKLQIESPLFDELGIPVPQMRVAACAPSKDNEKLFSIKMNFIGLSPNEYQKIRVWMMQNDPRKTKKAS